MKRIDCLSIEGIGSRVHYLTWGNRTWTFARTVGKILPTILYFHEETPIPRTRIADEDYAFDIIIQRLETPRPPRPIYRPVPVDNSPELPFA